MDVNRAAALAELRTVRWSPVLGALGAAGVLAVLDLTAWFDGPLSLLTWLSAAVLGGAAALALDEPRHDASEAAPTSRRQRTVVRLLLPVLACGAWAAYSWRVLWVVRSEGGTVSWAVLSVVAVATVVAAAAGASLIRRAGHAEPGGLVACSAVGVAVALILVPLPAGLHPSDTSGAMGAVALWCVVTGLSLVALWWSTRDVWTTRAPDLRKR